MDPIRLNAYQYAGDNPIKYVDVEGDIHVLAAAIAGGFYGFGATFVSDLLAGDRSSWQIYVGNVIGGAAGGAALAATGNVWLAAATMSGVSMGTTNSLNLLSGKPTMSIGNIIGQLALETLIGGAAGQFAAREIPRGPGREPIKLVASLTGKIGRRVLWMQGLLQGLHFTIDRSIWMKLKAMMEKEKIEYIKINDREYKLGSSGDEYYFESVD